MPRELDPQIAERIASGAMFSLNPSPGNKVLCTKQALHQAFLAVARETHEIGFLAGQKERLGELTCPGSPDRPAWMDIQLEPADLARHQIHLKPVVLKSLNAAGYHCLGDLRWTSDRELRGLYYVGIRTAQAIVAVVRDFETGANSSGESDRATGPKSK